jgi:hypothetical protein
VVDLADSKNAITTGLEPASLPSRGGEEYAPRVHFARRAFYDEPTIKDLFACSYCETLLPYFMSYIMVDIESDGPVPGDYSMVCFGAVVVEPGLERTFYG